MLSKCKSADDSSFGIVLKCGLMKKLKTSKKKYFVLRAEKYDTSACLEYYDSEKKFNSGQTPKRTIPLKTCFNINKRSDTKHKHVIALYTKDDCFCVILDTEESLDAWLKALLSQQQGEEATDGQIPRPTFEHVWQVQVLQRGLGATPLWGIVSGQSNGFRLCLTDKTLSLIRADSDKAQIELELSSVRSCGFLEKYFYLEAGRCSSIGVGELWMETEDANIARNVHQTVCHAMSSNKASREDIRPRANSDTDYAKNYPMKRREPLTPSNLPPLQQGVSDSRTNDMQTQQQQPFRQRTTSEGAPPAGNRYNRFQHHHITSFPTYITTTTFERPQSYYVPPGEIPRSPPSCSPVSPPSVDCSTDSAESSLSIDDRDSWQDSEQTIHYPNHPPTPSDGAIPEENCDDGVDSPCDMQHTYGGLVPSDYMDMQPASSDDGCYVDSPRGVGAGGKMLNMSPATSNCSITSGTPSMEYPLEKVTSFLAQSEEDESSSTDRPTRTYSVGSRPSTLKYQSHIEPTLSVSDSRKRAFSVGSKTKKVLRNRLFPHHSTSAAHPNMKSSSAPILSTRNLDHQRDDLMEMDFTKPPIINNNNSDYMQMEPPGSNKQNATTTPNDYVVMKPGHIESLTKSNRSRDDNSSYVHMKPGASPAKPVYMHSESRHGSVNSRSSRGSGSTEYMEMGQSFAKPSTSPLVNSSPMSQYVVNNISRGTDYMDMSFSSTKSNKDRNSFSSNASTDQYSASPVKNSISPMGSPPMDYVSMDYSHSRSGSDSKANNQQEGYVEMTLGKGSHHKRQSSADSGRISYSDFAKITPGGGTLIKDRKNSGKRDKNRSAPIMIHSTTQNQTGIHDSSPGSPMLTGYPPNRKYSTGTPPTSMHLPLSAGSSISSTSYTSLPRQQSRSRKNSSRRESRDSSSSSVTTPSSSSTMFPISLNSPMSPIKLSVIKVPPAVLKAKYDVSSAAFGGSSSRDDYTIMDFDKSSIHNIAAFNVSATTTTVPCIVTGTGLPSTAIILNTTTSVEDNSDYVNYNPAQNALNQTITSENRLSNDEGGDYAIMKPGVLSRLLSDTGTSAPLMPDASCCFRPIIDEVLLKSGVTTSTTTTISSTDDISPAAQRLQSSVSFTTCRQNSDSGRPSSETRSVLSSASSRPSSTSSELSSSASTLVGGCSRPGSVNSDQIVTPATLHYAKLDLSSESGSSSSQQTAGGSDSNSSPRSAKCTEGTSAAAIEAVQPTFTYAQIDFVKSENFKPHPQSTTGSVGQQGTTQSQQCSAKLKH